MPKGAPELDPVARDAASHPIWAKCGHAIQAYSELEQSLFILFTQLTFMEPHISGIVFFKIVNSGARNSIIEKLIKQRHGEKYNKFWNSFIDQLRPIDIKRNEIVHWTGLTRLSRRSGLTSLTDVHLIPPNF